MALIAALLAFGAVPVLAEEHDSGHEAAGRADKPALLDWDLGSAFWSIIVFVIVLAILRATAWKPILQGLQKREQFITDSIRDAKREREDAQKLLADYAKKIEQARTESSAIVEEGRRDGEEVRKRIHAEAKAEADAMVARAKKEIEMARDDAVKQLYDQTVALATSVAGKIVRKELAPADHKRLLDESLAELSRVN